MTDNTHPPAKESPAQRNLGIAGRMAAAFIHSPLSPILLLISLAIGILGLMITPRQEDPQISVPMIDIFVGYPGASAQQVQSLVTDPLERIMSEISGVKHVYSMSQRDQAMVTVQFEVGEAMEPSLVKLYDRLHSNMDRIPPGATQPLVKPKGVDDVPVVTLTLWSQSTDDAMLRLIGLEVLQRLKEVPNTSQSFLVGGRPEQLRIEPLPERLAGHGISLNQIAQTVQAANTERGVGSFEGAGGHFQVYTGSFLRYAEDVERLIVGTAHGAPIYLRDIARVIQGPGETEQMVHYYTGPSSYLDAPVPGAQAVTIAIAKKAGTNGVTVANDILERLEHLKGRVIPDDVYVSITRNYGETANDKVNELMFKLFIATAAVTVLVWVFLGLRAAGVVLVIIPIVLLVTVFSAWALSYTVDRVSLFALIFAIGILVDDAIVVVENIYRRWLLEKQSDTHTAIDAVREVGNPTILATFTVIAALLPMGFVSGMMGPYMQPIPVLGSVAMLFSLFAAFIFTPWLTMRLKPSMASLQKAADKEHRQSERIERFFRRLILGLAHNRTKGYVFLFAIIAAFFASTLLFYTKDVRVKMLPLDNKPEFSVIINLPEGTPLTVTENLLHEMAMVMSEVPEVISVQTYSGTASPFNFNGLVRHYYLRQQPWQGDMQVNLLHKDQRKRTSHQIAVEARELLTPLAHAVGARIQVVEMPPGPPVLQAVVAEIYGPDAQTRRQVARDMMQMFENAEHLSDVDSFLHTPHDVWRFVVDREKALRVGVSVEAVNTTLDKALGSFVLGDIKHHSLLEPTLIVLQLPLEVRSDLSRLLSLPVISESGSKVPLAELGRFERTLQDEPIFHKDLRPVEYVTGETVGRLAAPIYGMFEVEAQLADYVSPDGVQLNSHWLGPPKTNFESAFEWAGEWTVTYETFRDMGLAFGVALVLIYMLVVWEFGNFTLPSIVMAPIPLTLIGIIPGHWLLNAEFTATSMIGFIALAGIIVRNSILLVDFAREAIRDKGMSIEEAVIKSVQTRTRPIIITALALVAGSSVILFDPIFQGMAISLMFGVVVSTVLTLVVIPLGCISARNAFDGPDGTPPPRQGGPSTPPPPGPTDKTDNLPSAGMAPNSPPSAGLNTQANTSTPVLQKIMQSAPMRYLKALLVSLWALLRELGRKAWLQALRIHQRTKAQAANTGNTVSHPAPPPPHATPPVTETTSVAPGVVDTTPPSQAVPAVTAEHEVRFAPAAPPPAAFTATPVAPAPAAVAPTLDDADDVQQNADTASAFWQQRPRRGIRLKDNL
ncbi:efflux RND transporter permease subunit [Thiorhodospira sibirica]|uniref:efflux RND transporter permease subunit n=1 Tax=Thiorhodospira sibirica TaxID=154347 RepID=UPI00022C119F|nr:efflux RND transporter permease subunit [Thiorhodospira sibirica]